ncbi:hypothetical protein H5T89_02750 [bacterium]|nr:hypothetical protein [bacterium]
MGITTPSIEEWRQLFDLAIKFKETKSWEWMDYINVFGVQDPNTGEICYFNVVDVSGEEGNLYALALYPGDEGLISLLEILDERRPEDEQFYFSDIIVVQFSDRGFLSREDLEIIKKLGLKFRGKGNWISFKRMLPGYLPRIINKEEANLLLATLEQAIDICLMFRDNPELKVKDETLIRTSKKEGPNIIWEDKWVELDYPPEELSVYDPKEVIENGINAIKPQRSLEEWAIDFLFLPNPVRDDEESEEIYFPYFGIVMNNITKAGINFGMYKYSREDRLTYPVELFLNTVEITDRLPRSIVVRDEDVYNVLLEIVKPLKIALKLVEKIEPAEEFKRLIKGSLEE